MVATFPCCRALPSPQRRQQEGHGPDPQTLDKVIDPDFNPPPSRQQEEDEPDGGDTAVRVKYDARLHGARVVGRKEPLTTAFLQKYIQYAKNRYKCAVGPLHEPRPTPFASLCALH